MGKFIPKKTEKEVISMRISVDLLSEVDEKAAKVGVSRNEMINQMIVYALANIDEELER
ncbi:MAG: ribbon-helix-helix protein, CopG family [Firmicutes bacterium]|nr:ribbon-helix-helix protein, CopG family [Bacillota bacterium]MBQ4093088.1 ribbon-helix-helix protein, CopG family [Bacillota bacterium]